MKQFGFIFIFLLFSTISSAQSVNQDFPSPILKDEINAAIAARDIGDSRLTRHFYVFYAGVGDLFLNIETANFNGDIDLFEATTLRPISKISIYASDTASTTSRIVYFRQKSKVLLRIEGRTPNDDPARYKINLSGSFAAATDLPQPPEDLEPKVGDRISSETVAKVNSAGAIIEVLPPKNPPKPEKVEPEKNESEPEIAGEEPKAAPTPKPARTPRTNPARRTPTRRTAPPKTETAASEPANEETETAPAPKPRPTRNPTARRNNASRNSAPKPAPAEPKVDPLANVQLVVLLKDGYKIERPMSEILRVTVDKGTLVVVTKSGKIERFSLLDVAKFSIEQ